MVRPLATTITGGELSYTLQPARSKLTVMGIMSWVAVAQRYRRAMILVSLLTTSAGVALVLNQPERTFLAWLGIPFIVGGAAMLVGIVWPTTAGLSEAPPSLASHLIRRATMNGRLGPPFPIIVVLLLEGDSVYTLQLSASPALHTE